MADISKEHDTCLALGQAVMLPCDVVDLADENSIEPCDLMVMQYVQVRIFSLLHYNDF